MCTSSRGGNQCWRVRQPRTAASAHSNAAPKESPQAAVDAIASDAGYVNLLIANSGVVGPAEPYNPSLSIPNLRRNLFDDVAMADFMQTFDVNVTGACFTVLAFLELLNAGNKNALKGGFGALKKEGSDVPLIPSQVIFAGSISSYSRHISPPPAYTGSKAAIAHMAKACEHAIREV
ncbi:hypothetical protein DL770_000036 [Monosporascus sp. CRB-9-2]|nr:hypothetical protein DL770_000036 [Monosporascus sp. CRB-9-2]